MLVSRLCGEGASRRGVDPCSLSQLDCIFSTVNFCRRVRCSMSATDVEGGEHVHDWLLLPMLTRGVLCWLNMCCARTVTCALTFARIMS